MVLKFCSINSNQLNPGLIYYFRACCLQGRRNRGVRGSNEPPKIYLGVKHGILTPSFLERNIFWYTGQLILRAKSLKLLPSQRTNFKAKMHKTRFRLGIRSVPAGAAYSAPHIAGFKGAFSNVALVILTPSQNGSCVPGCLC